MENIENTVGSFVVKEDIILKQNISAQRSLIWNQTMKYRSQELLFLNEYSLNAENTSTLQYHY